ncbi:glycosyltransferase family 2 protein, partial [Halomonas sp. KM-1]|uniref:glycosyltransferase family 2 protein n=1 Tax=Halomonas sp. KM-1 TaxID=590061 RepID=UPI00130DEEE0
MHYYFMRGYAKIPFKVRNIVPGAVRIFIKENILRINKVGVVESVDNKLWGGFSASALEELNRIKEESGPKQSAEAAWCLFRWHSINKEFSQALENIKFVRNRLPKAGLYPRQILPEVSMLALNAQHEEARSVLVEKKEYITSHASYQMALANTWVGINEDEVLNAINAMYSQAGFLTIEKIDKTQTLTIDNIQCESDCSATGSNSLKVTVIVPAYNAEDKILTSLLSLQQQTWQNLEVIVVDDCSTDNTEGVVRDFCQSDERFRYLKNERNGGSYYSRNHALEVATGDLVTIHDADDWSHAQKIEVQVKHLLSEKVPYNFSFWTRVSDNLFFWGTASRPGTHDDLVTLNHSSALFHLDEVKALGGWDTVRIAADNELIRRYERQLGMPATNYVTRGCQSECPLSFGRLDFNSLTQKKLTHVVTAWHGMRKEYRERAGFWYDKVLAERPKERFNGLKPPFFESPEEIRSNRSAAPSLSRLYIGDFSRSKSAKKNICLIAAFNSKCDAGIFSYPDYDNFSSVTFVSLARRYAEDSNLRICIAGEELEVDEVVILNPQLFEHVLDRFPEIKASKIKILQNNEMETVSKKALSNISSMLKVEASSLSFF